jgi:hypothetical protein
MLQILIKLNVVSWHDLSSKIEFDPRIGWRAEDGITTHGAPYAEPQWRRADGSPPALRLPIHKQPVRLPGGWWLVLIYSERKILLADRMVGLFWQKSTAGWCLTSQTKLAKTCLEPGGHSGRTTQPNQQLGCRVDHRYSGGRTARVQTNIRSTVSQLGILEGM